MKTYNEILNEIRDASGIDNPNTWLWKKTNGIYYPVKEIHNLLAEFLGAKISPEGDYNMYDFISGLGEGAFAIHHFKNEDMLFDTDWNWLMEVVGKIENLNYSFEIIGNYCKIGNNTNIQCSQPTKIEAVYKACVEFVKWYKENK